MTSFYFHLAWFIFLFIFFIVFFMLSIYISFINQSFFLSFSLFSMWNNDIKFSIYIDYISSWFSSVVLFISCVVIIYSYFYMSPYSKSVYFLWLTNLFIASMLFVINFSNLFFIILGWDGLGLISFFLIVYYQNQSSITSGIFTLLMNRLGDRFFLVTITLLFYYYSDLFSFRSNLLPFMGTLFLLLTFITKRAIYPFSPWLPLAIAAPTPISALVHSSTLVTSGLFLIIRFSYIFYNSYFFIKLLLIFRMFTSFYAGINSIVEKDLKKLIALSTLRHLGFIGMAFSSGLLNLAFFHLLTHALFKSLLFISIGDIMINLNHSQDIRYLSSGMLYTPMSCIVMYVSLLNLLGLPSLRGYFSKDLVLEIINYSGSSVFVIFILFMNVFFTYYYTYQLFFYSFRTNKVFPYQLFNSPSIFHSFLLLLLSLMTLVFRYFFINFICCDLIFYPVPLINKNIPFLLNLSIFFILLFNGHLFSFMSPVVNYYFSNIMFLSNLILSFASNLYYNMGFYLVKSLEFGLLNYSLNGYVSTSFFYISRLVLSLSVLSPIKVLLYRIGFVLFIFILILLNNIIYYVWLLLIISLNEFNIKLSSLILKFVVCIHRIGFPLLVDVIWFLFNLKFYYLGSFIKNCFFFYLRKSFT